MLYDYIYIKSKLYRYGIKVLSKMGACGTQKEIYQQGRHFYDFKEGRKLAANN